MWRPQRELLLKATQEMVRHGLVGNYSGNASLRLNEKTSAGLVLVTPSHRAYSELEAEELVVVDLEGEPVEGAMAPSSETHLHLEIYKRREDVGAILHTHSIFASVAAVAGLAIPPIVDEMVITLGGEVPIAEYGFPGTEELSQRTVEALGDRNAVLLRNHGLVGVGSTLEQALEVCHLVERVAQIFVHASRLGKAYPLSPEIIEIERSLFLMQREARALTGSENADGP